MSSIMSSIEEIPLQSYVTNSNMTEVSLPTTIDTDLLSTVTGLTGVIDLSNEQALRTFLLMPREANCATGNTNMFGSI